LVVHALGWDDAQRLGHHWVGEEHLLLALSRRDGVAGVVLRAAGATPERLEQTILAGLERADPPVEPTATEWQTLTPAANATLGRAEGIALTRGSEPAAEDVLVALFWHAGYGSWLLHELGVDRAALASQLAAAGVAVPPGAPEPLDLRPQKRVDVPYDHLRELIAALPQLLPDGSPFGFNLDHETRRAWIVVAEDVDGDALARAILADKLPD